MKRQIERGQSPFSCETIRWNLSFHQDGDVCMCIKSYQNEIPFEIPNKFTSEMQRKLYAKQPHCCRCRAVSFELLT